MVKQSHKSQHKLKQRYSYSYIGTLQVLIDNKKTPGSYIKIFTKNHNNINQFYRDGYTDINGNFRYALT